MPDPPDDDDEGAELSAISRQLVRDVRATSDPRVAPFFLPEHSAIACQGVQRYPAIVIAQREDIVLFVALETRQLGIGYLNATEISDARQYPKAGTAIMSFLGRREDLDPQ